MKRRISLFALLLLILSLSVPAHAFDPGAPWVVDNGERLTQEEETSLIQKIRLLREELQLEIVIVTTYSSGGEWMIASYADDFYDQNGYGYGDDDSGILLLIDLGSRQWYMSTSGEAIDIFPDYALDRLGEEIVSDLSAEAYYTAFDTWLDSLSYYVEQHRSKGSPQSSYYDPGYGYSDRYTDYTIQSRGLQLGIPILIGLVAAFVTVFTMRSQMNTTKLQKGAANYMKNGSFRLFQNHDIYLYSRVSKRARSNNTSSGGGSGHRSSSHRSSGGVRHGGRGGRF